MPATKPLTALIFAVSNALVDRLVEALRSQPGSAVHTHVSTYEAFRAAEMEQCWSVLFIEHVESNSFNPAASLKGSQLQTPYLVVARTDHEDQAAECAAAWDCEYVLWDISPRRVELALRQNLRAFERRSRCEGLFHEAEAMLVQKPRLDALERVARGLAHDFNNVTTVISTMANFVRDELASDDPRHADMTEVIKAGERASALSRQLMVFSSRANEIRCLVDASAVVESCEGLLRRTLGEKIEWKAALEPNLWPVFIDPVQFEQLLFRLALRACELMPSGGLFAIATRNSELRSAASGIGRARDCVELRIDCTNADVEILGKLDLASSKRPCQRLADEGLMPARTIVERAKGDLTVSITDQKQLTFVVQLPRATSLYQT